MLNKAELCIQELTSHSKNKKETPDDVVNPPPTPETDGQENSGDSSDHLNINESHNINTRNVHNYEEDFLDINLDNNMDLF